MGQLNLKVAVLHASVGSGHKTAAYAIKDALAQMQSEVTYDVQVLDILDFGRIKFDGNKTAASFTGATRWYYDLSWRYFLTGRLLWAGGTAWARLMFPKFTAWAKNWQPDLIISTHITAVNVAIGARMINKQTYPIVCVPTDYEVEGMWPHLTADLFCVATESMAETLRSRLVPEQKIMVTGLPCGDKFEHTITQDVAKTTLKTEGINLPSDKPVAMLLVGAALPQPYVRMRTLIASALPLFDQTNKWHLVFVCGKDADYKAQLADDLQSCDMSACSTVLDYCDNLPLLMSACDLVICKSGGLIVTECLAQQKPMMLVGRAYGQEKINAQLLTANGAALFEETAREMVKELNILSDYPQILQALRTNGQHLRAPEAAKRVVTESLSLLNNQARALPKKHFLHFYWGKQPAHRR